MVIDLLLNMLGALIDWFNQNRPAWEVHLDQSVGTMIGMLKGFDQILPVTETLACLTLIVSLLGVFTTVKWTIKLIDWIADIIP